MTEFRTEPREILSLTGIRAAAALAVVAFHFALDLVPESAWLLHRLVGSGFVAVSFFFVLSGFVLAHHYEPERFQTPHELRRFWVRRFARVYPLYLLSLAVGAAAAWPKSLYELAAPPEALRLGLQLLLLNAWHHVAMFKWNWAAWSLSVEAAFYFVFPWLIVALRKLSTLRLWLLLAVCWTATFAAPALYTALDPDGFGRPFEVHDDALFAWYLKFFPVHRFPEFIAGLGAGLLYTRRRGDLSERTAAATTIAAMVVLLVFLTSKLIPHAYLQAGVLLPVFLAIIRGLATPSFVGTAASWRPLLTLGRASYAIYILHVPVFSLLAHFDPTMWTVPGRHLPLYAVVLIAASLVAHRWIEQPCRRWLVLSLRARVIT